jgi:short subunit dehydrogenase-like uncharacterized protein
MSRERRYDIVLFGATGFTGSLTAEYLARHAPPGTAWALAGRNRARLQAVRAKLGALNRACAELPLLHADAADRTSMRALAASTRVAASTVGPYITRGEPLVAACAEAGTDYVDICGEPEFVDAMYLGHHERATSSGARLVHCCGFESIACDLGVYFTITQLPENVPLCVEATLWLGLGGWSGVTGTFSAGSWHSALTMLSRPRQGLRTASARRRLEPGPGAGRRVRALRGTPRYQRSTRAWLLPAAGNDVRVVCRSAGALERYGPDFAYRQWVGFGRLASAATMLGAAPTLFVFAQLGPARNMLRRMARSGEGPSPKQRERRWFKLRIAGVGGGERVLTEVSGGDPGYDETAKMLAESSLCLAQDELAPLAGQLTPAAAMGGALLERLRRAGIAFRRDGVAEAASRRRH